ncbi:branched-chain amino acid ABC transporter substrate-binding protein [Microvirga terrestris]|uniref:Branched-chain amino acid ABC transporter substrate-binding protein n=1 Tax=Microvirga terrestris TaxID=2791024 RepID=A0ABS0HRC7_9HYPH|nr:branched-chain amino acid ABC transporter substrate-binding protein [Microvirga terrestris]MBF9195811.1 branched-chain amino acid ABC transporter substrate-binding protein [Microvirga terrestris]
MERKLLRLAAALVFAMVNAGSAGAEILIGMAGALTGPNAYQGEQQQQGVELAIGDINAAGGVLGQKLRLISVDDACDGGQAIAAAHKLVAENVAFVVGHQCSGASIPAAGIYERAGVIQMTPASTNPRLTEEGRPNVFRICGRDDQQGAIAGAYLAARGKDSRIAILSDGSVYGKGLTEETRRHLRNNGGAETLYDELDPGLSDFSNLIMKLQAAGIRIVYFAGYYREAAILIRNAREQGYNLQLVSGDSIASEAFIQVTGEAGEGTVFTSFRDPRRNPDAAALVERFRQNGFEPEGYTLYSYGAVQAWAQAVVKAGSIEPQAVISALRSNEFETILGRVSFDAKGDVRQPGFEWFIWRKGRYVPLE